MQDYIDIISGGKNAFKEMNSAFEGRSDDVFEFYNDDFTDQLRVRKVKKRVLQPK